MLHPMLPRCCIEPPRTFATGGYPLEIKQAISEHSTEE